MSRYVAMHSMTAATSAQDDTPVTGYIDHGSNKDGLAKGDIAFVLVGLLVPLVTQVGHVH
jgi:zinc transporter 9